MENYSGSECQQYLSYSISSTAIICHLNLNDWGLNDRNVSWKLCWLTWQSWISYREISPVRHKINTVNVGNYRVKQMSKDHKTRTNWPKQKSKHMELDSMLIHFFHATIICQTQSTAKSCCHYHVQSQSLTQGAISPKFW